MSLTTLRLTAVVRAAAELAQATDQYQPGDHPEILAAQADPLHARGSASVDAQLCWSDALDRIVEAANRLKVALGASGSLRPADIRDDGPPPSWHNLQSRFFATDYSPPVRAGLRRLANAAMDLSGYATVIQPPELMRVRGLAGLDRGLRQIWPALAPGERKEVRSELAVLRRILAWAGKPPADPPRYGGPMDLTAEEESRVIDEIGGFYTRGREHLDALHRMAVLAVTRSSDSQAASPPNVQSQPRSEPASPASIRTETPVAGSTSGMSQADLLPPSAASLALLRVFTTGLIDNRIEKAERILADQNMTVSNKLFRIDELIPFPPTASANKLAILLNVSKTAVLKSEWWQTKRAGEKADEVGRRRAQHSAKAARLEPPGRGGVEDDR
jgi:hypothetical protein